MTEEKLGKFIINYLTEKQYAEAQAAGTLNDNDFYCTIDDMQSAESTYQSIAELEAKVTELEAKVAELEAEQNQIAVDPEDTTNMNIWIATS